MKIPKNAEDEYCSIMTLMDDCKMYENPQKMLRMNIVQSEAGHFPIILLVKSLSAGWTSLLSLMHFVFAVKFNVKSEKQPKFNLD